jgi:hypothetical protein
MSAWALRHRGAARLLAVLAAIGCAAGIVGGVAAARADGPVPSPVPTPAPPPAVPPQFPSGVWHLTDHFTSRCVDDSGADGADQLHGLTCQVSDDQNWQVTTVVDQGTSWEVVVKNVATGRCLDDSGADSADLLQGSPCLDSQNQKWQMSASPNGEWVLKNDATGRCLNDTTDPAYGLLGWPCNGLDYQRWTLTPPPPSQFPDGVSFLANLQTSRCLNDSGGNSADHLEGYLCLINAYRGNAYQNWQVTTVVNNGTARQVVFKNLATGRCLDDNGPDSGDVLRGYPCIAGDQNQIWQMSPDPWGGWDLKNMATGRCLDDSTPNGTDLLRGYPCNGGSWQRWYWATFE